MTSLINYILLLYFFNFTVKVALLNTHARRYARTNTDPHTLTLVLLCFFFFISNILFISL